MGGVLQMWLFLCFFSVYITKLYETQASELVALLQTQNLSLHKDLSSLAHFLLWVLCGADLFLSLDFEFCILLLSCCALESTTQWRLSAIMMQNYVSLQCHQK